MNFSLAFLTSIVFYLRRKVNTACTRIWATSYKWLKDRRERRLDLDDIRAYCRIVTALGITLALQAEIDAVYAAVEGATVTL